MSEERIAVLEDQLRTVTDRVGGLMDLIQQKGFEPFFICGHSGLLLPADYLKGYGRLYGIGLGPDPVSEVLDSDYDTAPPDITPEIESIEQIMHPIRVSRAQVDFTLLPPNHGRPLAILEKDDRRMLKRAQVVYQKQLKNPRGRLRVMRAKWEAV